MNPAGLFITGTDTGVGKTVLSAVLLTLLRRHGVDAAPMKPIQTGCLRTPSGLRAPDLDVCLAAAGMQASDEERRRLAPVRFEPACSPHLAARLADTVVEEEPILEAFADTARRHEAVLVEGAGGLLVPVNAQCSMLDLMVRIGLPVVLAARPTLGTLNHTLLSLDVLRRARCEVWAVVLVDTTPGPWTCIEEDNLRTIADLGALPVLRLPWLGACAGPTLPAEEAAPYLQPLIDRVLRGRSAAEVSGGTDGTP